MIAVENNPPTQMDWRLEIKNKTVLKISSGVFLMDAYIYIDEILTILHLNRNLGFHGAVALTYIVACTKVPQNI